MVGDAGDGVVSYDELLASASTDEPAGTASGDDMLFIMYTSGTTGLPKGVIHTHDTVLWAILTIAATSDFRKRDRFLNSLPLFHVGALGPVIACVYAGVSLTVMKAFDPTASWELIRDEQITTTLMVPAMLQFMLLTHNAEEHDVSTLRWVMSGAAPVPKSLIEAYQALDQLRVASCGYARPIIGIVLKPGTHVPTHDHRLRGQNNIVPCNAPERVVTNRLTEE